MAVRYNFRYKGRIKIAEAAGLQTSKLYSLEL